MSIDQPRTPAGAPEGGQFAGVERPEATVELPELTDAEYNADGTFEFPPIARSARQVLLFWTRVPVGDSILERVRNSYRDHRFDERKALEAQAELDARTRPEAKERMVANSLDETGYVKRVMTNDEKMKPLAIWAEDVRTLARAERAYQQAGALPEAERDLVDNHQIHVGQLGGLVTIKTAHETYRLDEVKEAFSDPLRWTPSVIRELTHVIEDRLGGAGEG